MGLPVPDLDDREFAELVEDARKLIPVHSEEWTDHNVHDPGITILEVLSWVAESDIYRLDKVTEAHVRKYLKLMGVRPRPPRPASIRLELRETGGGAIPAELDGRTIPAGTKLSADDRSGSETVFETADPVTLNGARIERVVSEHRRGLTDNSNSNRTDGMYFLAFGQEAEEGSAMYLGFERDPFGSADLLDLAVDFHEDDLPETSSHGDEDPVFEPSVGVSWEYLDDYSKWASDDSWRDLQVSRDETNHLYRGGRVTLVKPGTPEDPKWTPDEWAVDEARVLDGDPGFYWIRGTVVFPPSRGWDGARPDAPDPCEEATAPEPNGPGYEVPPRIDSLKLNVVKAEHRSTTERRETLRRADDGEVALRQSPDVREAETTALPGQTFAFDRSPVLEMTSEKGEDTIVVGGDEWERVDDFDASGPDDRHFVLEDWEAVRFGDDVRGKVPEAGQEVAVETYTHGGGTAGNVPRSAAFRFTRDTLVTEGVYTYFCEPHRADGMKGAIVVGDPPDGDDAVSEPDYRGWFDDVDNYVGTVDERGASQVSVEVGAEGNDGPFAFSPPAVRVDPGTTVRFSWVSDAHNVVVEDKPPGGAWAGHPPVESAEYAFSYTFQPSVGLRNVTISPEGPAEGGADAESVRSALNRLKEDMKTPYRAVTPEDYRYVATNTPGLRFGRAKAVVTPAEDVEGDHCEGQNGVTVVVVPYSPRARPEPSVGFLDAVRCHLEKHRLLTDRVEVEPPTYVGIGVEAEVGISPGYSETGRTAAVEDALDAFLDPLEGFAGDGWPFGRPVYESEIYEAIEGVDGIDCVLDVTIRARGAGASYRDGGVEIGDLALVYPEDHDVGVRTGRDRCKEDF